MEPPSPFDSVSDEAQESTRLEESPFAHDPEPPLGIVHLMGWIGFTAAFLGIHQFILNCMSDSVPDSTGYAIIRVAWSLGAGISMGSLLIMAVRRWRHVPFPNHPGEFLLVLHGFATVVTFIAWGVTVTLVGSGYSWAMVLTMVLPQMAVVIFTAVWATQKIALRHWRVYFVSFAALTALLLVLQFVLQYVFWAPAWMRYSMRLAMPVLLAYALFSDRQTQQRRPWTHWLGIALQAWLWFIEWFLPYLILFV